MKRRTPPNRWIFEIQFCVPNIILPEIIKKHLITNRKGRMPLQTLYLRYRLRIKSTIDLIRLSDIQPIMSRPLRIDFGSSSIALQLLWIAQGILILLAIYVIMKEDGFDFGYTIYKG